MEACLLKLPLAGIPAAPGLDTSMHGRSYAGLLYHGTSFSYLPAICSAGCLLRCSIPTRGKHAIWTGEAPSRALMYAPPVRVGGKEVQCILCVDAMRVKGSHFKSSDKQLILRECWAQLKWLLLFEYKGQQLYKTTVDSLARPLPQFVWSPSYANWDPLPEPWVVANSSSRPANNNSGVVPSLPYPQLA